MGDFSNKVINMDPRESMSRFLTGLGARRRENYFVLDEFSTEFYLVFDMDDPEDPNLVGTVDIYVADIGSHPKDSETKTRVMTDCRRHQVMRFLLALGSERFAEKTQQFLRESNSVIHTA